MNRKKKFKKKKKHNNNNNNKMDKLQFIPNDILTKIFKELTKYKKDYQ